MQTITSRKDLRKAIKKELQENMTIEQLYNTIYDKYNVKFEFTKQLLTYHVRALAIPKGMTTNSYNHNVTIYQLKGGESSWKNK